MPLLDVVDLKIQFHTRNKVVKAVDGISFQVEPGKTLAIVGESGSGKSVACYSLLQLLTSPPAQVTCGKALFKPDNVESLDLLHCSKREIQGIRGNQIGMVFQDSLSSLNPYLSILYIGVNCNITSQLIGALLNGSFGQSTDIARNTRI